MDTSETYIKMCEKAEEIQVIYSKDSTVRYTPNNAGHLADSKLDYLYRHKLGDKPIWLPRQDQLQEMMGNLNDPQDAIRLGCYFSCVALSTLQTEYFNQFAGSMEQLWLAFVMKEKHNKVWNGEDWV